MSLALLEIDLLHPLNTRLVFALLTSVTRNDDLQTGITDGRVGESFLLKALYTICTVLKLVLVVLAVEIDTGCAGC